MKPLSIFLCLFLYGTQFLCSQDSFDYPLFSENTLLELTFTTDLRALIKDDGPEPEYHPSTIAYIDENGEPVEVSLKTRVRGNFRRKKCSFPPLRLNFPKKAVMETVFAGQDKLKLVTHCTGKEAYQRFLIMEYLIYRMYNVMTDLSFRVRLVKINYVDTGGKIKPMTRYGFIIEDEDAMAERVGGTITETKNIHPNHLVYEQVDLLSVFQYMVANTDWSIPGLHNIKILTPNEPGAYMAVPYDFDWCGLVAAPYAMPNQELLGISSVKERLYRGFCRSEEAFQATFDIFLEKKGEITNVLAKCPYLDDKIKEQGLKYLADFFDTISSPKHIKAEFLNKCRN